MLIDDCKLCKNHVLFQNGYVICTYWNMKEQRVTGTRGDSIYIVECPSEKNQKKRK